jgi:hypothetical protein
MTHETIRSIMKTPRATLLFVTAAIVPGGLLLLVPTLYRWLQGVCAARGRTAAPAEATVERER